MNFEFLSTKYLIRFFCSCHTSSSRS